MPDERFEEVVPPDERTVLLLDDEPTLDELLPDERLVVPVLRTEVDDELLVVPVLRTEVDDELLDELPAETLFASVVRNVVADELLDEPLFEPLLLVVIVPPVTRTTPLFDDEPTFDELLLDELLDELPP